MDDISSTILSAFNCKESLSMSSDAKSSSVVNLFKLLISVTFTEASLIGVLPPRSAPARTIVSSTA